MPTSKTPGDRPLRVAMVIQRFRPSFSGQGIQVEALTQALVRRGVGVCIMTATAGAGRTAEVCDGYTVVRFGHDPPVGLPRAYRSRMTGPMFAWHSFSFLQRTGGFDLVHVHAMTDALYSSLAWCRLHDKRVLFEMTLVGTDDPLTVAQSSHRFASVRRRLYRRCDGYVAISPALREISREAGFPASRVALIPQGVDVDRFRPVDDRKRLRQALGLPTDGPLLTFVGSLVQRKGFDVLLDAWSRIQQVHPTARLLLVGRDQFDGHRAEASFLTAQLERVPGPACERMHRVGVQEHVERYLQASDLFLFPSRREGFGTVMVEAMACGLPCVVAELPGITDFIFPDRPTGVVVPQNDALGLATEALQLLEDADRAAAIGAAARADAVARFDIDMLAGRYVDYYRHLIARVGTYGAP